MTPSILAVLALSLAQNPIPADPPPVMIRKLQLGGGRVQFQPVGGQPIPTPGTGEKSTEMKPGMPGDGPPVFEVRTTDESSLRVSVLDSTFELATSFGPLVIPVKDVRKIDIGTRLTPDDQKLIQAAIVQLLSLERKARVLGREAVIALGGKALPAVRRAKRGVTDGEILAGLNDVESRLAAGIRDKGEKELADRDTIQTDGSTFTGLLAATQIKVLTGPFGEQKINVTDIRSARSLVAESPDEEGELIAFPVNGMVMFQGQFGKIYRVRVTGVMNGNVWGTGTYTLDSYLPMAAVHAGAIRVGEAGIVKIKIVPSPNQFTGSSQNGVNSGNYGQYPTGAYEILTKK